MDRINDFWENNFIQSFLYISKFNGIPFQTRIIHADPLCSIIYAQLRVIIRIGGAICRVFHRLLYRFAVQIGSEPELTERISAARFTSCFTTRGYNATRWEPLPLLAIAAALLCPGHDFSARFLAWKRPSVDTSPSRRSSRLMDSFAQRFLLLFSLTYVCFEKFEKFAKSDICRFADQASLEWKINGKKVCCEERI